MPTHASAKKQHRQDIVRRERNRRLRSQLRSALKSVRGAIDSGDAPRIAEELKGSQSLIDRMVAKGIIHRNAAARYKSRLTHRATPPAAA